MTNVPLCSIAVTGRGVVSAIGASNAEFAANLIAAKGGIDLHDHLFADRPVYAGLVSAHENVTGLDTVAPGGFDRTARLACAAVAQALREARLWDEERLAVDGERVALLLGTSHGGRSQLDRFSESGMNADDRDAARGVMERSAHHHQSSVVATLFGVHGPVITVSTACSSSGTAIAHGVELLRSGRVDVVIAGGADAFSKLTYAGFSALGAVADGPCGPFGQNVGMTLGEGAAFVVLERLDCARERGAAIVGQLYGCGTSWDAHHLTAPEPSGKGMSAAIADTLALAGMSAGEVDYINAHATGTRANDVAETLAIKRAFDNARIPPVSATKSFTGHTLGASSAIGVIGGFAAMQAGALPPTLNFGEARPGCDLDYVPDVPVATDVNRFLAHSAAFGGANCVIAGGNADVPARQVMAEIDSVVISGLGVISPLGCRSSTFFDALLAGQCVASSSEDAAEFTAPVAGFDARRDLPPGSGARMDRITQYAIAAIHQAFTDAGLGNARQRGAKTGLMVGLCRGAAASFETYLKSVRGGEWERASPVSFPNLVMSSVGGKAAIALGLRGPASTMVGGVDVALTLLSNAAECLQRRSDVDAIVVVVADELTPLYQHLDRTHRGALPALPYAEGAVAFVLERRERTVARAGQIRAEVAGWAQTFDGAAGPSLSADGAWLERAIRHAVQRSGSAIQDIDLMVTLARGEALHDQREAAVVKRLFGDKLPALTALSGHTGLAESTSGFFATAAAILALESGHVPAPAGKLKESLSSAWLSAAEQGSYTQALIAGSSDFGSNSAVVLRRQIEAACP
ncbi:putative Beta-ketoacyl-acyl-carrier-protein synthase II [Paraburkholderia ribeironis]|uniref:Putative Beta-ketoacyl-acyl-carrier-protein synthase II n=1 Tax=Paraburkholderia ribeironis TaxID=1247936 RepID=A0A1N7S843_9BURK|nr:beta-ketoacyl-[acyl-carrier-protein] synthase family protein [Paraburkholderia ribeironis]SIT43186.1 putative Beta-ketoacyl-acyl-carrier-protein synthase II [Paraburkholderia ribeironis]